MLFEDINYDSIVRLYNDFDIDPDVSLDEQLYSLIEDLYQVEFSFDCAIDIGYYPEFRKKGEFWIQVINECDWTSPLYSKRTRDLKKLEQYLYECIQVVNDLINTKKTN